MVHGELTQASSARLAMVNPAEIMLSRVAAPRLHPRQQQRTDQIASVIPISRGASCIELLTVPGQKFYAHTAASPVNWCSRLLKTTAAACRVT